jgi:hypothetical protein
MLPKRRVKVVLREGVPPMSVATPSHSVMLMKDVPVEVDYHFYEAHLKPYVEIFRPKVIRKREENTDKFVGG